MKELSSIAAAIQPSATLAVNTLFKQMKADGLDVVGFGAGEPDFSTPSNISEAGVRAIEEGKTRYTPSAGIIPLRKAIAARLKADCGVQYDHTQIVVASGAKHGIYITLCALCNPGDEVILPGPYWVSYCEMIRMAGAVPVIVTAGEAQHFKITPEQLEAAVTEKTKLVIINNPSNPTGMLYSEDELRALADVCVRHDLYILAYEIYYKLVYDDNRFVSVASLSEEIKERTILVNGVSKTYAMTGWRIGFTASNPEIARVMSNYLSHSTGAPSTISQWAALEAVNGPQESVEQMRRVFEQRRTYLVEHMNQIDGVSCLMPQGAFYVMMNIDRLIGRTLGGRVIHNADDFAMAFLETSLVAVVSCTSFGLPNFVRWTYASSMETIQEGLRRLEAFLSE